MQHASFPVLHSLPKFAQTHIHWVGDAIQPSHPLSLLSPPALNLSQHQGLFQWVSSLHQVAKGLEFQYQHQSFQWICWGLHLLTSALPTKRIDMEVKDMKIWKQTFEGSDSSPPKPMIGSSHQKLRGLPCWLSNKEFACDAGDKPKVRREVLNQFAFRNSRRCTPIDILIWGFCPPELREKRFLLF